MKILSWNVNGIRAAAKKGFAEFLKKQSPDIIGIQETKAHPSQLDDDLLNIDGYKSYWSSAVRKGYSGVAFYTKKDPLSVIEGIGNEEYDNEGRTLTLEFKDFFLVNAYFPNSQAELKRMDYKLGFDKTFLKFCEKLRKNKPVIFCGDLNVAHKEIDLKNPKTNTMNPGFCIDERNWFSGMLEKGYIDTFRMFCEEPDQYTWWSYRFGAREKNIGWRIDYFIVSDELRKSVKKSFILPEIMGSDHCPIALQI